MKKLHVGDSINFKDGRVGVVEDYDNKYFYIRDNNTNIVKIKKVKDSKYSPEEMLNYLCNIDYNFDLTREEWVNSIIKMLKMPLSEGNLQEYLEMNGSNEEMNGEILQFVSENPDFDWNKVKNI